MALISCPECKREISSLATSCPQCGTPIAAAAAVRATGDTLTTTQSTAKRFKAQTLIAALLIVLGFLIALVSAQTPGSSGTSFGAWMFVLGVLWYLVTRVRSWWHHG